MVKLDQGADDPSDTGTDSSPLNWTIYSDNIIAATNIYDKGKIYSPETSEPDPCDQESDPTLKKVFHTSDNDKHVNIATTTKKKLTRNSSTLYKSIWDKFNTEFDNTIETEWNSFKKGKVMPE